MFDFAWSEFALIGVVALVFIGPKDMPVAIKAVSDVVKKARKMASEFQTHVDEMVKDTELADVRKQINEIRRFDIKGTIERAIDDDGSLRRAFTEDPFKTPPPVYTPPPAPQAAPAEVAESGEVATLVAEAPAPDEPDMASAAAYEASAAPAAPVADVAADSGAPAFIPPSIASPPIPPAFIPPGTRSPVSWSERTDRMT